MFNRCYKLEYLDFSNFITENCENIFEIVGNTNLTIFFGKNRDRCQNMIKELNYTVNIEYIDFIEELF